MCIKNILYLIFELQALLLFLYLSITDPYESMVASILSQLLVDGPASPFYQSLLDANIGSDYSPGTG